MTEATVRRRRRAVPSDRVGPLAALLCLAPLAGHGCVAYEPMPVYAPVPSTYDRAWNAALRAAQDSGINLSTVDRPAGIIRGGKDGIEVRISVVRQADGSTRVATNFQGPLDQDPGLSDRFQAAYERYMGR